MSEHRQRAFPRIHHFMALLVILVLALPFAPFDAETASSIVHAGHGPTGAGRTWMLPVVFFAFGLIVGASIAWVVLRVVAKSRCRPEERAETLPGAGAEPGTQGRDREAEPRKAPAQEQAYVVDERLIQSNKLTAFGQLSTGVAHEINNPLAIINEEAGWLADLLKQGESEGFERMDDFRESLGIIVQQTRRCANITHKLLSFAQNMDSDVRDLNLSEIIDEIVIMMEKDASYNAISIERVHEPDLPGLRSDPGHLRQLFVNLIKNALDAVGSNGRITVRSCRAGDGKVSVMVSDTGCGIPKDHLDKVFDPFFTTKAPNKGSGLGLSICYGIVTMLGGTISVESVLHHGTTFTVTLPVLPPEDQKARMVDSD